MPVNLSFTRPVCVCVRVCVRLSLSLCDASELVFHQTSGARGEVRTNHIVVHTRVVLLYLACARVFRV
jgi:hypothetical protein